MIFLQIIRDCVTVIPTDKLLTPKGDEILHVFLLQTLLQVRKIIYFVPLSAAGCAQVTQER